MHRHDPDRVVTALMASRHGVVTREEALAAGLSGRQIDRRVSSGRWKRLQPGVYGVAGAPPGWHAALLAAVLAAGPTSAASHRAAGRLWRLEGLERAPVEVSSRRWRRRPRGEGIVLHESTDLVPADIVTVSGLPCTTVARTLVDVGGVVHRDRLETAVDDALRRGLVTLAELDALRRRIARKGRTGAGPMRALLDERSVLAGVAESGFERRLVRLLVVAGLPPPVLQHELWVDGVFVARFDGAWPEFRVAVEADGEAWHTSRRRFVDDRTRRALAEAAGWRVLAYTWAHLTEHPDLIVDTARGALVSAGWSPHRLVS